jgi:hypothetical protein
MSHLYQVRYKKGDLEVVVETDEKAFILEQLERLENEGIQPIAPENDPPRSRAHADVGGIAGTPVYAAPTGDQDALARWVL